MTHFSDILAHGASHAWLYFPSAILLGALHGLEPGHSKTLMAAFIVAIRGTVKQAVMLGLAATVSHTAVVWLIAIGGMYLGRNFDGATAEPYFQLASAALVIAIALWMLWRTWLGERQWKLSQELGHEHIHDDDHDEVRIVDTGHGKVELSIVEESGPPRWRLKVLSGHQWSAADVSVVTKRDDGINEHFRFVECVSPVSNATYLESVDSIPEPHAFDVVASLGHGSHTHDYELKFSEHHHDHDHSALEGLEVGSAEYQDAHERAHARDIEKRFADRTVTDRRILMFGLTGGLVPCPAAVTVLLLCLQVKQVALGAVLVLFFSIGLAITLVSVGVAAAISVRKASSRWPWLATAARRAPYLSSGVMVLVGVYVAYQGFVGIYG